MINARKVAAHTSMGDIINGHACLEDHLGNEIADACSRAASEMELHWRPVAEYLAKIESVAYLLARRLSFIEALDHQTRGPILVPEPTQAQSPDLPSVEIATRGAHDALGKQCH